MPVSRLRLRLTGWFALAFAGALLVLGCSLFLFSHRRASSQLTGRLQRAGLQLAEAIARESREPDSASLETAVLEALREWPVTDVTFIVRDASSRVLGTHGPTDILDLMTANTPLPSSDVSVTVPVNEEGGLRIVMVPVQVGSLNGSIVVASSTAVLQENQEALSSWLLFGAPLALLVSLTAGYVLSRQALQPIDQLGRAAAAIDPVRLSARLPVRSPPDEVDRVAGHINGLLDRLESANVRHRAFLREVAHQIRTPLTLVQGESEFDGQTAPELQSAIKRIHSASAQMTRRVGELFLLADAAAGVQPDLRERVELDALILDVVDLFRARAHVLGRSLELGQLDEAEVQGDRHLLQEAATELLENACRHGSGETPARISVRCSEDEARLEVSGAGVGIPDESAAGGKSGRHGMGLSIVRWIAEAHGGRLTIARELDRNQVTLVLPLATRPTTA